ncbi:hypothetical protein RJT34_13715 [Clitoria ternatea]|uniref:Uncharacterized protein n=1 Tax=Clitoria ternatea TaxID=43366 RepID=A0AAN9JR72_CLITE
MPQASPCVVCTFFHNDGGAAGSDTTPPQPSSKLHPWECLVLQHAATMKRRQGLPPATESSATGDTFYVLAAKDFLLVPLCHVVFNISRENVSYGNK